MSMMCRPKWPFLLMCVFHDVRHVEFRGLTGSQRTSGFWGVTLVMGIFTRIEVGQREFAHGDSFLEMSRKFYQDSPF